MHNHPNVKRAKELTPYECKCNFKVMDALDLKFEEGTFDGVWRMKKKKEIKKKKKREKEKKKRRKKP
jgi:MPBQ/MSBQ methyltransferase